MSCRLQALEVGGPLQEVRISVPSPDVGEVQVRIKAVGLNPIDWKQLYVDVIIRNRPKSNCKIESMGSMSHRGQQPLGMRHLALWRESAPGFRSLQ